MQRQWTQAGWATTRRGRTVRRGGTVEAVLGLIVIAALAGLAFFLGPRLAGADHGWHPTFEAGFDAADAEGKRHLLVLFTADWCGPCGNFKTNVLGNERVTEVLDRSFACVKIDLTDRTGPNNRVAQECEVRSIPTLMIYDEDGYHLATFSGSHDAGSFMDWLNRYR